MSITTWINISAIIVSITVALLLTNSRLAHANQPLEQEWFATELDAVVAAASRYNPASIREDREFMGAILRDGDCYTYTVGAGDHRRDEITVKISVAEGVDLIAFWHTHGARYARNRYFSDVDTRLVEKWQRPLYLAEYTGALKIISPGDRTLSTLRARHLGLPARMGYAKGRVVKGASGKPARILTRE